MATLVYVIYYRYVFLISVILLKVMEKLIDSAQRYFQEGLKRAEIQDARASLDYFQRAVKDLILLKPDKKRDSLLAQVYLSRYEVGKEIDFDKALTDLRVGYSYAKTCMEPAVQEKAQILWQKYLRENVIDK